MAGAETHREKYTSRRAKKGKGSINALEARKVYVLETRKRFSSKKPFTGRNVRPRKPKSQPRPSSPGKSRNELQWKGRRKKSIWGGEKKSIANSGFSFPENIVERKRRKKEYFRDERKIYLK